jgi:ABC-type Fe3+ transport system substrate-binding protein
MGSASGNVGLINRAPHPNAARVAIHWLLSREGQAAYQKLFDKPDSRRIDIPKEDVPAYSRRVEGVRSFASDKPDRMDLKPIVSLIQEIWKDKR